jgi:hypothetical protein
MDIALNFGTGLFDVIDKNLHSIWMWVDIEDPIEIFPVFNYCRFNIMCYSFFSSIFEIIMSDLWPFLYYDKI